MSRFGFGSVVMALLMLASFAQAQEDKDKDKPAAPAGAATTEPAAAFQSKSNGFTVVVPTNYEKTMENQPGLEVFLTRKTPDPGGTRANLIIATPPQPHGTPEKPLDLPAGYQAYRDMIKSGIPDMTVKEEGDTKVATEPAKFFVIEGHQADTKMLSKLKCVVAVHNGQLFGVFGMSEPAGYEQTGKDLDQLMSSWKWTSAGAGSGNAADGQKQ